MEYEACLGNFPCYANNGLSNKAIELPNEAHKGPILWRPLSTVEASSPCACGCIYIVNNKRTVEITSGDNCPTLPITWTVQVNKKSVYTKYGDKYAANLFLKGQWKEVCGLAIAISGIQLRQLHFER